MRETAGVIHRLLHLKFRKVSSRRGHAGFYVRLISGDYVLSLNLQSYNNRTLCNFLVLSLSLRNTLSIWLHCYPYHSGSPASTPPHNSLIDTHSLYLLTPFCCGLIDISHYYTLGHYMMFITVDPPNSQN